MFPPLAPQPADPTADLTSTAQDVVDDQNQKPEPDQANPKVKKRNEEFRDRVASCKNYRRKLIPNWTVSIDYRRGKPFASQTDEDQVAVNLDWSMTKSKQAALFSQIPQVRLSHGADTLPESMPWITAFEKHLNDELIGAGIESAMDEVLPDCINAAGIGVALVSYETINEDRQIKGVEGEDPSMETIPYSLDHRYVVQRISPSDLLWPINFTGANFDNAPWIGRTGRITWAEAVQKWGLSEDDKALILGEDRPTMDKLTHDVERDKLASDEMVGFDELWYKDYQYDPEAKSFSTIHHLVFVGGKEDPVVDEPWNGQKVDDTTKAISGATKFPLRCFTLTYITDETIPPSDSAIGRPQVNEINRGRTQMIKQRERSLPIRAVDVNRVDPAILSSLMRGTIQHMIPVQGDGQRIFTEVSRATMPVENFKFDQIAKADHQEMSGLGQVGSTEDSVAPGDPNQNKSSFSTQIGRERAKVASFFVGIAEVLGGLMFLYEDPQTFGQGFDPSASKMLKYSILADSTVLLDAGQKLSRLNQFVNTYAKSGWVNIQPVLEQIAVLTGLDPSIVIKAPSPKPPVEPNISLRLTGVEDMLNPLTLAFLMKSGQAPDAKLIEQAKALIQQAVVPPQGTDPTQPPQNGQPPTNQPGGTPPPGAPVPPPVPGPPQGTPVPPPQPPKVGDAHPAMSGLESVVKRTQGGQS